MPLLPRRPVILSIRIVTAGLIAFACAHFVATYGLLSFPFAPIASGALGAAATWLFLRQGEPTITALAFLCALLVGYKAFNPKPILVTSDKEAALIDGLFVDAARLNLDIQDGTKSDLKKMPQACFPPVCDWPVPNNTATFWLRATHKKSRDRDMVVWYIDDSFNVYSLSRPDGPFTRMAIPLRGNQK